MRNSNPNARRISSIRAASPTVGSQISHSVASDDRLLPLPGERLLGDPELSAGLGDGALVREHAQHGVPLLGRSEL